MFDAKLSGREVLSRVGKRAGEARGSWAVLPAEHARPGDERYHRVLATRPIHPVARPENRVIYWRLRRSRSARWCAAGLAQLVEQLFRKQQVVGSSPTVGSNRAELIDLTRAEVAEPADALRSGRSGGNPVGVQISPSAPALQDARVGHNRRGRHRPRSVVAARLVTGPYIDN